VKVRTSRVVSNRPAYLEVGVDVDGRKHVLRVWLGDGGEGAQFWPSVLTQLRNRGQTDVIFVLRRPQKSPGRHRVDLATGAGEDLHCPSEPVQPQILLVEGPQADRDGVTAGLHRPEPGGGD
jgi:hypothetical protein